MFFLGVVGSEMVSPLSHGNTSDKHCSDSGLMDEKSQLTIAVVMK